jgi:pyruvate/2-oxoglutarate dehydrogenase complex dihydrolipoamide dehydrogenase (E3) component
LDRHSPAAYHARVATANALFGARRRVEHAGIPWVTFTDPEVARVGLTAEQARERWGERAIVVDFEYRELDRAVVAGAAYGFARLVGDRRGRLVGATIAAPAAGEAIAELTAWIASAAKVAAISRTVHAYPTFAEGPARAAAITSAGASSVRACAGSRARHSRSCARCHAELMPDAVAGASEGDSCRVAQESA